MGQHGNPIAAHHHRIHSSCFTFIQTSFSTRESRTHSCARCRICNIKGACCRPCLLLLLRRLLLLLLRLLLLLLLLLLWLLLWQALLLLLLLLLVLLLLLLLLWLLLLLLLLWLLLWLQQALVRGPKEDRGNVAAGDLGEGW